MIYDKKLSFDDSKEITKTHSNADVNLKTFAGYSNSSIMITKHAYFTGKFCVATKKLYPRLISKPDIFPQKKVHFCYLNETLKGREFNSIFLQTYQLPGKEYPMHEEVAA